MILHGTTWHFGGDLLSPPLYTVELRLRAASHPLKITETPIVQMRVKPWHIESTAILIMAMETALIMPALNL